MQIRIPAKWMILISSIFFLLFYLLIFLVIGVPLNKVNIGDQEYSFVIKGFTERSINDIILSLNPEQINYISLAEFKILFKEYGVNNINISSYINDLDTAIPLFFILVGLFIALIVLCLLNVLVYKGRVFLISLDLLIKAMYLTLIGICGFMFYVYINLSIFKFSIDLNTTFTFHPISNFFTIFIIGLFVFPSLILIVHSILNKSLYSKKR